MEMQQNSLPNAFKDMRSSLEPYIMKRKEIASIRRVLACHLDSQLNEQHQQLSRPLCLMEVSRIEAPPRGVRGLLKDYIHAVRNNIKAKTAYADILKDFGHEPLLHHDNVDLIAPKLNFLNVIRAHQKLKRLKIFETYIDILAQKSAGSQDHLDTNLALEAVESQPAVPSEILNIADVGRPVGEELHELVDELEKAVLRAKILLKREQKLLASLKYGNDQSNIGQDTRMEALGITRNELIVWIETELSRAGDISSDQGETATTPSQGALGKGQLQSHLESSKLQYSRYVLSRKDLILAVEGTISSAGSQGETQNTDMLLSKESSYRPSSLIPILATYLEALVSVSNEQRAMIHQRSHISVALAKQLKDAGQGLDRLADESHLLQVHPLPKTISTQTGLGVPVLFGDEISNGEKPDLSHRAQPWVFAVASAGAALKDCVTERLDEGGVALLEAQESLLRLLGFLGNDVEVGSGGAKEDLMDIWAVLDGKLGVI